MSDGAGGNVVDTVALCDEPDVEMLCDVEEEAADVELETEAEEEDECDLDFTCVAEEEEDPEIEWNCESDKNGVGSASLGKEAYSIELRAPYKLESNKNDAKKREHEIVASYKPQGEVSQT